MRLGGNRRWVPPSFENNKKRYRAHKFFLTISSIQLRSRGYNCSLRTADVFPVVVIFRKERSDDRKNVCGSQAKPRLDFAFFLGGKSSSSLANLDNILWSKT